MKRLIKYIWIAFGLCLGILTSLPSKGQQVWEEVHLSRSSVYVGQPVNVSIKVYTSTWFTKGIDLGNLQVNGAFTNYFRSVNGSFSRNGKTYSNVELIYQVFPYKEEDVMFPSLEITIETPPEGDYKGVKMKVSSDEKLIKVKPIPPGFETNDWLVATGLSVNDRWLGSLKEVKVGDVLERRIVRTASGTMARLIPPVQWDSVPGLGLYPSRTEVNDNKGKTEISSSRTESMRYLFEKEGEVTIPEMVFHWYNPYQDKLYKRTLKEVKIEVKPNPNMGMLASIRDSLATQQAQLVLEAEEDKPFEWLGLSWKQLVVVGLVIVALIYFLIKIVQRLIAWSKAKRQAYLHSERYYWDLFRKSVQKGHHKEALKAIYRWIDELDLKEPSLNYFIRVYGTSDLKARLDSLNGKIETSFFNNHLDDFHLSRKRYLKNKERAFRQPRFWINP
ncbi:BatD family protein [Echinicola shivajiensis]|uniref:BatD family protein n=1 Tax=Echinicola shivajiensis TaxID=1035916 RepID=UPI001BFC626B|nr:BatD family protein [Echinicola shivajiensis]